MKDQIEKQAIEEMAKLICAHQQCFNYNIIGACVWNRCRAVDFAKKLYKAGYRKQSEPTSCENEIGGEWKPVMDGKYQFKDEVYEPFWKCSKCGLNSMFDEDDWFKFCPNCGAKMKDGAE